MFGGILLKTGKTGVRLAFALAALFSAYLPNSAENSDVFP
jgi:hypothetical protein